ncbi:MAG: membrane protein insertion efficiency factor YidD [Vicinamibacteria bacterium]|nr:membrane protein insertion efficiency factor YidD [Vicinamibacteria bacterium]
MTWKRNAEEGSALSPGKRVGPCAWLLILAIRIYRATFSIFLAGQCRYIPSCSAYAEEAIRRHGAMRGSWLTIRRLLRCHPFHAGGYDPVP